MCAPDVLALPGIVAVMTFRVYRLWRLQLLLAALRFWHLYNTRYKSSPLSYE